MLPQPYSDAYAHLQQTLRDLEGCLQDEPDMPGLTLGLTTVQTQFQTQVLALSPTVLSPTQCQSIQAVQPEIHKYLRLLRTDLAFLQAARQSSTRQQRCALMRDRVQTLIRLCDYLNRLE